jgi:hypothetical protein
MRDPPLAAEEPSIAQQGKESIRHGTGTILEYRMVTPENDGVVTRGLRRQASPFILIFK